MRWHALLLAVLTTSSLVVLLAGCGGQAEPTGDCLVAEMGQLVPGPCVEEGEPPLPTPTPFTGTDIILDGGGDQHPGLRLFVREGTCFTCHIIEGVPQATGQLGPDLTGIGAQGADYIRQSIVEPNAVLAEQCPTGPCEADVMPQNFGELLTPEQIDAIVEYLVSLQ